MRVLLEQIAQARSGDKGANSNVGVVFADRRVYDWALGWLTTERVKEHFRRIALGDVARFELPNLLALNFILGESLGGGGSLSLKSDAQGKTHGQAILRMVVELPDELAELVDPL
ncbi:MAG: hypothetical protein Q8O14_04070 [bacterium]|jgi:hypothetical protein|nr:hypothetical protein [bacterium]